MTRPGGRWMSIGKYELQTKLMLKVVIPLPQLDQA